MSMNPGPTQIANAPDFNPVPSNVRTAAQVEADRIRHDRERELRQFKANEIGYADLTHAENRALVDGWRESAARQRAEDEANRVEAAKILASRRPKPTDERERLIAAELQRMEIERTIAKNAADRADACQRLGIVDPSADAQ